MSDFVLKAHHLSKSYREGSNSLQVLDNISLELKAGESVAIIGTSGSGKSTLLNCLGGLDKPTGGSVQINDKDINTISERERCQLRNRYLGFIYQFHHLLPEFTTLENVCMPLLIDSRDVAQSKELASAVLSDMGLGQRLNHKPGELSGGERQRVAIARALVNEPDCVLMDEPTGNLDEHTGEGVQALFESLRDQLGIAFVMVTHDMKMARSLGRVMRLEQGRLIQEV